VVAFNPTPVSLDLRWAPAEACGREVIEYHVEYRMDRVGAFGFQQHFKVHDLQQHFDANGTEKGYIVTITDLEVRSVFACVHGDDRLND
jgi:hypothetical protein